MAGAWESIVGNVHGWTLELKNQEEEARSKKNE